MGHLVGTFNMLKEKLRFVVFMPFILIVILLMVYFGWIISIARKIPEDLEEQVRCANLHDSIQNGLE